MKKLYIYTLGFLALILMQSCNVESTGNVSKITEFAEIKLAGDNEVLLSKGDAYVEPGATATAAGVSVDVTTASTGLFRGGTLDPNIPDIYTLSYSAFNADGFEATAARKVIVADTGDLVTDLSGLYRSTVLRNGTGGANYTDMEYVLIWKKADGTFQFSDGIGAWYLYGRALGIGYAATGATVKVNGLNDYTFGPAFSVSTFGGVAKMTEMTVDPAAKTIDLTTEWDAGPYTFKIHLDQVQF